MGVTRLVVSQPVQHEYSTADSGPQGPKGDTGLTGPTGPAGGVNSVNGATGAVTVAQIGTAAATASTIPIRDASGRMKAATPSATDDVANKAYADALGTSAATANTIVRLDANGRAQVVSPSVAADIANKSYVDAADVAAAPRIFLAHTAAIALNNAVWTRVGFSATALENVGGTTYWDITAALTSRRVLVKIAGLYQIDYVFRADAGAIVGRFGTAPSATATVTLGTVYSHSSTATGLGQGSTSTIIRLAANTYIGCEIYNNFGSVTNSSVNNVGTPGEPHTLSILRISD